MDIEKASSTNTASTKPDGLTTANSSSITKSISVLQERADAPSGSTTEAAPSYLTGWRLHFLTTASCSPYPLLPKILITLCRMCLSVFLSSLETTIVSTSLVSIVESLKGSSQASWIVTSYLLTYTGASSCPRPSGCCVLKLSKDFSSYGPKPPISSAGSSASQRQLWYLWPRPGDVERPRQLLNCMFHKTKLITAGAT